MGKLIHIIGKKFTRLLVIESGPTIITKSGQTQRTYKCRCECGKVIVTRGCDLRGEGSKSCGCLQRENTGNASRTHGKRHTKEYHVWAGIKSRCTNPNHHAYKNYGGRGIKMHPSWQDSFEQFLKDLPPKIKGLDQIDRIENNKGYEPGNIRWANGAMQSANKRSNVWVEIDGAKLHLRGWARKLGVTDGMLRHRRNRFGSNEAAIRSVINGIK